MCIHMVYCIQVMDGWAYVTDGIFTEWLLTVGTYVPVLHYMSYCPSETQLLTNEPYTNQFVLFCVRHCFVLFCVCYWFLCHQLYCVCVCRCVGVDVGTWVCCQFVHLCFSEQILVGITGVDSLVCTVLIFLWINHVDEWRLVLSYRPPPDLPDIPSPTFVRKAESLQEELISVSYSSCST